MDIDFTGERVVPNRTPYYEFQQHINRYHFASSLTKNKTVLDVACGTGYGSDYLIRKGAKKVIGIDISKDAINYAKHNYKNPHLTFITGNATTLPFQDEHFDIIVSFETIEHITEYKKFLDECRRVLKIGGIFICSTPNKKYTSILQYSNPFHVIEFYPNEFHDLVNEYFSCTTLYGQNDVNLIKRRIIIIGRKIIEIFPHDIKAHFNKLVSNKNSILKTGEIIDKHYKITEFQNTKLKMSEFLVIIAKKF